MKETYHTSAQGVGAPNLIVLGHHHHHRLPPLDDYTSAAFDATISILFMFAWHAGHTILTSETRLTRRFGLLNTQESLLMNGANSCALLEPGSPLESCHLPHQ